MKDPGERPIFFWASVTSNTVLWLRNDLNMIARAPENMSHEDNIKLFITIYFNIWTYISLSLELLRRVAVFQ